MKAPFGALFPAVAIALAIAAVASEANYGISFPAAVGAVIAASFALWDAARRSARPDVPPARRPEPELVGVRAWIGHGVVGRTEILLLVDRIDRGTDHPDLPIRSDAEVDRLVRLSPEQFRAYVNARLDAIEGVA
jgi:hypothetical protein